MVAMDWVDGTDLATLLDDRGRPGLAPSSVLAYLSQAAEALTHLHSQVRRSSTATSSRQI